jgi:hypothetical protein
MRRPVPASPPPNSPLAAPPLQSLRRRPVAPGTQRTIQGALPPRSVSSRRHTTPKQIRPPHRKSCALLFRRWCGVPHSPQLFSRRKQSRSHRVQRYLQNLRQLHVRLPLDLSPPQQRRLFFRQAFKGIGHQRGRLCSVFSMLIGWIFVRYPRPVFAPPFRSAISPRTEEIRAQCSPLRYEAIRPPPNLRECFLHHVFRCLRIPDQKRSQSRSLLAIERLERPRVSAANLFPELAIVSQCASSLVYSSSESKRFSFDTVFVHVPAARPTKLRFGA